MILCTCHTQGYLPPGHIWGLPTVKVSGEIDSANAISFVCCYTCQLVGHLTRDCPHQGTIDCFVAQHAGGLHGGSNRSQGGSNGLGGWMDRSRSRNWSAANVSSMTTNVTDTSGPLVSPESAGVANSFLFSSLHLADGCVMTQSSGPHKPDQCVSCHHQIGRAQV